MYEPQKVHWPCAQAYITWITRLSASLYGVITWP